MTSITPTSPAPAPSSVAAPRAGSTGAQALSAPPPAPTTDVASGGFQQSIDPALGITVLKFLSAAGAVTQSFPSQKQLDSYRLYGLDKEAGSLSVDNK